jgi:PAS domain S-box-containing protein
MLTITGYSIYETLYESSNTLIFRAHRTNDNLPVILKTLRDEYPSAEQIAKFKREFEIAHSLNPGIDAGEPVTRVVATYDLEKYRHSFVIVSEDFGGKSLDRWMKAGRANLPANELSDFLLLAIQVVKAIAHIHQRHIIHKNINPSNIVLNKDTGQVKIIDFGISAPLPKENTTFINPSILEGALAYIAPEQTGRINRSVDYRSDFYSLGATFYELLTGQTPFPTSDVLELVHCHIAKQPIAPNELCSYIPNVVSNIVLKLLAKDAEDRYQSAHGILADLNKCLRHWQTNGKIEIFPLGRQEVPNRLQIPQTLYGREEEIEALLAAFRRTTLGSSEMMLVYGASGIGKTTLVQELHKLVTLRRGYFISGKFDQFQCNIPYYAFIQAFRFLVRQLLTESQASVAAWREKFQASLGSNGRFILQVIPELRLIIGEETSSPDSETTEIQNIFHIAFQDFIRIFTQPEHPLIIFLDDLQWADGASLKLIELFLTATNSRHLFFVGAYRDNEVRDDHPLMLTAKKIRTAGLTVNTIALSPLQFHHVNMLASDMFQCPPDRCQPLAVVLTEKTGGNPFFLLEFLKNLYTKGFILFDCNLGWNWQLAQIQALDVTDNVVDLVARKAKDLQPETQRVLKHAVCIGNKFDLKTLSIIHEKSPIETAADLWPALEIGLVLPLSETYKLMMMDLEGLGDEITVEYKFAHDRVQQAAYTLIPSGERQSMHWRIGQLLLKNTNPTELDSRIFNIVNLLNQGRGAINDRSEQYELSELNFLAAKRAKASAAYKPAFDYLQIGIKLLEKNGWDTRYDQMLALHLEASKMAYLSGDYKSMECLVAEVLANAGMLLDKVRVYEIVIQSYIAQNKPLLAVETALTILNLLGVKIHRKPKRWHYWLGLLETKTALAGKQIDDLIYPPTMTDPHKLAAMRILSKVVAAIYVAAPYLLPLVVFKVVTLTIRHGNASESAYAYAGYGFVLCGALGDIEAGYRFGQLSLKLMEKINAKILKARILFVFNAAIRHWKEHVKETLNPLLEAYQSGIKTGDIEYAAHSAGYYSVYSYCSGRDLVRIAEELASYSEAIGRLKQETSLQWNRIYRQAVLNLIGHTEKPCFLAGEAYSEEEMLPLHLSAMDRNALYHLYLNKLILCYLFQNYGQAVENAAKAKKYLYSVIETFTFALFHFYDSLAQLAVISESTKKEQRQILKKVKANQKKMKKWAHHAPMNHLHKYCLVEAEQARVLGCFTEAGALYDKAAVLARENDYLNEEALVYELAGKFYLSQRKPKIAQVYLQDAYYAYSRWGALSKVKDIEIRYPNLLTQTKIDAFVDGSGLTAGTILKQDGQVLDLTTVIKASQAISGEIVLHRLLTKLMTILIENAGAQRGFLALEKDGVWAIEEEGAASVINYVIRTQEIMVLADAANEGLFITDPYIAARQTKSILCMPLLHQGKLIGILYLENNLTTSAFTCERLEVLRLLSGQMTISIINARLYDELEQHVQERTSELSRANVNLMQEVSERKKAESAIKDSEKFLSDIINYLPDATLVIDREGKVIAWNQAIEEMTGVKAEDIVGKGNYEYSLPFYGIRRPMMIDLVFGRDEEIENQYLYIREEGDVFVTETNIHLKGKNRDIWAKASPLYDSMGKIIGAIESFRDISDHKQMEAELLHAKNAAEEAHHLAEAANRAKSTFLANMSHEIRTPLNSIVGFTNLLSDTEMYAKQRDYLDKIFISSQNLLGVINDILDFSKIEAGKLDLDNSVFEPQRIMDNLYTMFFDSANAKGIVLNISIARDVPSTLMGDPLRLRQVLINLANNAIKFTNAGQVTISVGLERTDSQKARLLFSIMDTGIGMPEEVLTRIFDIFTQADGSMTRRFGGTGLGLSICKGLIEMMGGEIWVESTVGKGSTFHFTADFNHSINEHKIKNGITQSEIIKNIRGAQVLLVEDNIINQQLAKELLEGAGLVVRVANNGREALEAVRIRDYDAVLMDVQMPVMSGYEATRLIRGDPLTSNVPIIAMTAHVIQEAHEECLSAGMNDYITKPIDRNVLLSVLTRWVKPKLPRRENESETTCGKTRDNALEPALPDILPGIDISSALKRLGGNTKLLVRLLKMFSHDYAGTTEEIKAALNSNNMEKALRLAHTVKGVAGNLSAEELRKAASELEKSIMQQPQDSVDRRLEVFDRFLQQMTESLQFLESHFPEEITGSAPIDMNIECAHKSPTDLKKAIHQLETESIQLWEKAKQSLIFDEIYSFGLHIKAQGEKYQIKSLEKFGDTMLKYVRSFDIKNIKQLLNFFPELIDRIKSL